MNQNSLLQFYQKQPGVWDEMCYHDDIRSPYKNFFLSIADLPPAEMTHKDEMAKKLFMSQGITFTVYNSGEGIEKIFPFDIIPRIITSDEWALIESGLKQRLNALNVFLKDIYHRQFILNDGIIPSQLIYSCPNFLREMMNVDVPFDIYTHVSGVDLIRDGEGRFYVLEDNLRTPSGVSYMLENRSITYRIFPDLLPKNNVRTVKEYPDLLYKNLLALGNRQISNPTVILLSPGIYNSAYFEHTTLARLMGIELVEGRDLIVNNNHVYMKTTKGLQQVDVIYRRVDDEFIDPLVFRPDSILGVPGIYWAYRKGNVAIVNAMGNGVADDKAIYSYVPDMIRYYLNEEPILQNVPTYRLADEDSKKYVFENMSNMVIKRTNESGGYGMLMGNIASDEEMQTFRNAINAEPRNFIAQPIISLSTTPCYINGILQPRRVDLRPFALYGPEGINIVPGGLTRVALKEGSMIVNSSQGGGSKDTWVLS
ncbi:MAG: circularly permuted type 2 ATP-grasp protein [Bacteroidota bacterium]|nr:circularly permuted type 2 ATP-grasp protein [Bacteroidota bacterium]MDQ6889756.1 circularly permuted type 2 ATP-grasp protein [Bacteroidota bacterium]